MRWPVKGPHRILYLVLPLILAILPSICQALVIDPQQQLQYAAKLYDQGQYRLSAQEYQRFAYFFPDHPQRRNAILNSGRAFLRADAPSAALEQFKQLSRAFDIDPLAIEAHFMMVECYVHMRSITNAVTQLHNIITLSDSEAVKDRAYYRLSWIYIDQTDWRSAQQALIKITSAGRGRYGVDQLEPVLAESSSIPQKNPALAGTLSIIPGAGQLYVQRYEDALIAFIVNVGLFWAAYDAYDAEQYALGSLLAFAGIGFYAGNIYGAISDAHKFNRSRQQGFADRLKQDHLYDSGHPPQASAKGLIFGFHFAF